MNNSIVLLALIALLGWVLAAFFMSEADGLQNDCQGLFPAVKETIQYYDDVCSEDINKYKLERLWIKTKDLNLLIKQQGS